MSSNGNHGGAEVSRELPATHGELPPWEVSDLPAPPPFDLRGIMKVIGP